MREILELDIDKILFLTKGIRGYPHHFFTADNAVEDYQAAAFLKMIYNAIDKVNAAELLEEPVYVLRVTKTLYQEIEYYNLPDSGNGYSAQTYSRIPVEQQAYEEFEQAYAAATKGSNGKGGYYYIRIPAWDSEMLKVAVNCIANVASLVGSAAVEPRPALEKHCMQVLGRIKTATGIENKSA